MRVLVVDDEQDIRLVVQAALDDDEVVQACDGTGALAILAREVVDVVLLDVMLPLMDGFEVLEQIRATPHLSDLPVVMLTAKVGESDHALAYGAGADGYLTKPFDVDTLCTLLQDVTRRDARARAAHREQELARAELLLQFEDRFGG